MTESEFSLLDYYMPFIGTGFPFGSNQQAVYQFLGAQPPLYLDGASGDTTVLDVLKYRAEISRWAAGLIRELTDYITQYAEVITFQDIPQLKYYAEGGKETTAQDKILNLTQAISDQTTPIINGLLTAINKFLVISPPTLDVNGILALVESELKNVELGFGQTSIYHYRNLYTGFLQAILLSNYFVIPTTESAAITSEVNAFITRAKNRLDTEVVLLDRRNINVLAANWTLDSTIASDLLSRAQIKKAREYVDIDAQAEALRQEKIAQAYQRQVDRATVRVQAFGHAPLELQAAVAGILGEAVAARYINPNQFASNLPSVINSSVDGLVQLMNSLQRSREHHMNLDLQSFGAVVNAIDVITRGLYNNAQAVAKFATMEAS